MVLTTQWHTSAVNMLKDCTVYLLRMGKTFKILLSSYWQEVIDNPLSEYLYLAFSFRLSAEIECNIVFKKTSLAV